jgi:hypothetical protein
MTTKPDLFHPAGYWRRNPRTTTTVLRKKPPEGFCLERITGVHGKKVEGGK